MDSGTAGECCGPSGIIYVNTREENARDILVHEVLHAILHETGLTHILESNTEEAIVCAIEAGLVRSGLIRDLE